jgi:hypothetical protein
MGMDDRSVRDRPLPEPEEHNGMDRPSEQPPLVIVEGFLSPTASFLRGDFETHLNARAAVSGHKRTVIFAS